MALNEKTLNKIKLGQLTVEDCATNHCLNPKKVKVFSSVDRTWHEIVVDCGHCVNCRNHKRNEWVTRMILHSFSYKYCYFVTLTYGSYDLHKYISHPFKKDWLSMYPVQDTFNSEHRPIWTPSILNHDILTKFFKRLRKYHGSEISFASCDEYGGTYGRPHHHCIIWTNEPLTYTQLINAWCLDCVKKDDSHIVQYNGKNDNGSRFKFHIGRVDAVDLVSNGTLDLLGINSDKTRNRTARKCFAYVAKYVVKEDLPNLYAFNRIKNVYDRQLPIDNYALTEIDDMFNTCRDSVIEDYNNLKKNNSTNLTLNEYEHREFNKYVEYYRKQPTTGREFKGKNVTLNQFIQMVTASFYTSRKYVIGKDYAIQNLSRFASGNLALPEIQGKTLTFPRYYTRLLRFEKFPLRFAVKVDGNTSLVQGDIEHVEGYYRQLRDSADFVDTVRNRVQDAPYISGLKYSDSIKLNGTGVLYQPIMIIPKKGYIHYDFLSDSDCFVGYHWSSNNRCYEVNEVIDRVEFCDLILNYCASHRKDWNDTVAPLLNAKSELYELIEDKQTVKDLRENYKAMRETLQSRYLSEHSLKSDKQ